MWDCVHLCCCFTSTTFCLARLWRIFMDFGSKPNSFQFHLQQRGAKWRLDVLWSNLVFAHHTHWWCQYRSWPEKESNIFLWVLGCVYPRFLVKNKLHIQNTSCIHKGGSGAGFWRSRHGRGLIVDLLSTNEWLWGRFKRCQKFLSNFYSANSSSGAKRAEPTDRWTAWSWIHVKNSTTLDGSTPWFKYEELDDWLDLYSAWRTPELRSNSFQSAEQNSVSIWSLCQQQSVLIVTWSQSSKKNEKHCENCS